MLLHVADSLVPTSRANLTHFETVIVLTENKVNIGIFLLLVDGLSKTGISV